MRDSDVEKGSTKNLHFSLPVSVVIAGIILVVLRVSWSADVGFCKFLDCSLWLVWSLRDLCSCSQSAKCGQRGHGTTLNFLVSKTADRQSMTGRRLSLSRTS